MATEEDAFVHRTHGFTEATGMRFEYFPPGGTGTKKKAEEWVEQGWDGDEQSDIWTLITRNWRFRCRGLTENPVRHE